MPVCHPCVHPPKGRRCLKEPGGCPSAVPGVSPSSPSQVQSGPVSSLSDYCPESHTSSGRKFSTSEQVSGRAPRSLRSRVLPGRGSQGRAGDGTVGALWIATHARRAQCGVECRLASKPGLLSEWQVRRSIQTTVLLLFIVLREVGTELALSARQSGLYLALRGPSQGGREEPVTGPPWGHRAPAPVPTPHPGLGSESLGGSHHPPCPSHPPRPVWTGPQRCRDWPPPGRCFGRMSLSSFALPMLPFIMYLQL